MKRNRWVGLACSFGSGTASECSLSTQPTAFAFTHATPDTELLAMAQGVFQAIFANNAASANLFGFFSAGASLREEQVGVNS